jgi:hypothetical protein
MVPEYPGAEMSDEIVWEFEGDDPPVSLDDLRNIELSRRFIDEWLVQQLAPGGKRLDPTDPDNRIRPAAKKS